MKALLTALFLTTAQPTELELDLPPHIAAACAKGGGCAILTNQALEALLNAAKSCRRGVTV